MSNLLDFYSNYCGVTPLEKPVDFPSAFTPLPDSKYITICTGALRPAEIYDHFNRVLFLVNLKHVVVQIGAAADYLIAGAVDHRGKLNLRQEAFVIANSSLHVGNDHVFHLIAESKGVKSIGVYGTMPASCTMPRTLHFPIEVEVSVRHSFAHSENPKKINSIFPERIAEEIASCLELEIEKTTTIRIGPKYNLEQIDFVPDFPIPARVFDGRKMVCRYDLCPNKESLVHFLHLYGGVILTQDPIDLQILSQFRQKIPQVWYFCDKNFSKDFVHGLHYSGIPYEIVTEKTGKELADLKLELMDYNQVKSQHIPVTDGVTSDMLFVTNRVFLSRNKFYPSLWHMSEDILFSKTGMPIGDALKSKKFLESWDNLYIYKND